MIKLFDKEMNEIKYDIANYQIEVFPLDNYKAICRENICMEPHYNNPDDEKRNNELKEFSKNLNTKIYCVPDESIIYFENGIKTEEGKIYYIE